ncbi:hypothetical protein [Paenibacillus medicaginis]|uniref:Uncharacterized protein n=1 Tax=Paenibacillus medicaginis TaxID=1470560 RepID=A0ABV5BYE8_9BACL
MYIDDDGNWLPYDDDDDVYFLEYDFEPDEYTHLCPNGTEVTITEYQSYLTIINHDTKDVLK